MQLVLLYGKYILFLHLSFKHFIHPFSTDYVFGSYSKHRKTFLFPCW